MVDNFELIKNYIEKQMIDREHGDCYYVQLLRRQADDPMKNGVKDPKYHGNMHSRSIKDYLIKSPEHLEDMKEDIIALCNMFNVRAYIRLNKRNYKNIALEMMKHIAEQCASGETYSSPFHLVASACGQCCQAGKDKTWIVDLDKEYLPYEGEIIDMICECEPHKKKIQEEIELSHGSGCFGIIYGRSDEETKKKYIARNFFIVPTSKVKVGDIIMHNDVPKCVVEVLPDTIKVIDYGTSTIEEIAPDRHIAMGAGYMYGKIVNPFISSIGGKGAMKKMLGFAAMNELMGNKSSGGMFSDGMFGQMMQMQMMMNMFGGKKDGEDCFNFFDGLFDIDFDFDSDKEDK